MDELLKLHPFPTERIGASVNFTVNENNGSSFSLIEILLCCILRVLIILSFGNIIKCLKKICHYIGTMSNIPCADLSESWDHNTHWMNQAELDVRMGTLEDAYVFPLMKISNLHLGNRTSTCSKNFQYFHKPFLVLQPRPHRLAHTYPTIISR